MLEEGGSSLAGSVREHSFSASGWSRAPPRQSVSSVAVSFPTAAPEGWHMGATILSECSNKLYWLWVLDICITAPLEKPNHQPQELLCSLTLHPLHLMDSHSPHHCLSLSDTISPISCAASITGSNALASWSLTLLPPESEDGKPGCLTYNLLILLGRAEQPSEDYSNLLMEGRFASKLVFHTGGGMW